MTRAALLALLALVLWLADATQAHACKFVHYPSVFLKFEDATTVSLGPFVKVSNESGRASLGATEALKGASPSRVVRFGNASCGPRIRKSRTPALVFMDERGVVSNYLMYVAKPSARLLATLRAWANAKDAADRVAVLRGAMSDADVGRDAALFVLELAEDPRLDLRRFDIERVRRRTGIDAEQLASLTAAAAAFHAAAAAAFHAAERDRDLAKRSGLPAESFARRDFAAVTRTAKLADILESSDDDAERIEAYERCGELHSLRFEFDGPADPDSWRARAAECRTGRRSVDLRLATDHRHDGLSVADFAAHDFEDVTDVAALADIMVDATGADRFPERIKAYHRCVQLQRERTPEGPGLLPLLPPSFVPVRHRDGLEGPHQGVPHRATEASMRGSSRGASRRTREHPPRVAGAMLHDFGTRERSSEHGRVRDRLNRLRGSRHVP